MERLIEAVRRYPCLWNTAAIEYRDLELKEAAWTEVMNNTSLTTVKEAKLKWKKLRDSYRDALKRQSDMQAREGASAGGAAAGGAKRVQVWKYMNNMNFLQPYMNNRKNMKQIAESSAGTHGGAGAGAGISPPENGHSQNGAEASSDESSSDGDSSPSPKRRKSHSDRDRDRDRLQHIDRKLEYLCKSQSKRPCSEADRRAVAAPDPLDIFFNSMCQSTKRLPYPTQIKIKKVLFNAVVSAEETLLAEQANYASLWAAEAGSSSTSEEEQPSAS